MRRYGAELTEEHGRRNRPMGTTNDVCRYEETPADAYRPDLVPDKKPPPDYHDNYSPPTTDRSVSLSLFS